MKKGEKSKEPRKTQLSVSVPPDLVGFMDQEIEKKIYASRSHMITKALQDLKDRAGKRP